MTRRLGATVWELYWAYPAPSVIVPPSPVYAQPATGITVRSAQAYYPYVSTLPEPWVLVTVTPPVTDPCPPLVAVRPLRRRPGRTRAR